MNWIEKEIRNILVKCLVKHSQENERHLKDTQVMFFPAVLDEVVCRYGLLNDYVFDKELKFSEVAGLMQTPLKPVIEGYIKNLFSVVSENESIALESVQIIIQATKSDPTYNDLIANLFNRGKLVRELKVSEFVQSNEDEGE